MAYNLPSNTILQIRIVGELHGQQTVNTFHYQNQVALNNAPNVLDDYLTRFEEVVYNPLVTYQSNEWVCEKLEIQPIWPLRYQPFAKVPVITEGVTIANSLPTGNAAVLRRKAVRATRRDQGRIYVPGIPVTAEIDSRLTPAYRTLLEENVIPGFDTALEPAGAPGPLTPVLFNLANPGVGVTIVSGAVDPNIRYQRRREVGRGS